MNRVVAMLYVDIIEWPINSEHLYYVVVPLWKTLDNFYCLLDFKKQ